MVTTIQVFRASTLVHWFVSCLDKALDKTNWNGLYYELLTRCNMLCLEEQINNKIGL